MTVTITRKTAVLLLAAVALAVTGTATAGKVAQMFTGANIVNGSLTGLDVKKASLGGALLKKNTLLASHFKAGQLPAGPQGPQGAQGPQGPQGPQGVAGSRRHARSSPSSTVTSSAQHEVPRARLPGRQGRDRRRRPDHLPGGQLGRLGGRPLVEPPERLGLDRPRDRGRPGRRSRHLAARGPRRLRRCRCVAIPRSETPERGRRPRAPGLRHASTQ